MGHLADLHRPAGSLSTGRGQLRPDMGGVNTGAASTQQHGPVSQTDGITGGPAGSQTRRQWTPDTTDLPARAAAVQRGAVEVVGADRRRRWTVGRRAPARYGRSSRHRHGSPAAVSLHCSDIPAAVG